MSRHALLLIILSCPLLAQIDHGSLNGTVTDPSNSLVPNAKVEAVLAATGLRRETTTGSAGTYQFPSLPIGVYTVTITKTGFRPAEYRNVELTVGQALTLDTHLTIGATSAVVEVTAA